jgi:hypothetical protein
MASIMQQQASCARHGQPRAAVPTWFLLVYGISAQLDGDAVVVIGEAGFGELEFQFAEHLDGDQNFFRPLADLLRHLYQNAMDLDQFFFQQADQFVVLLDGFQRFDENGLSAGACAMDYALNTALLLGLNGDDESLAADRYELVLHCAVIGQAAQKAAKGILD